MLWGVYTARQYRALSPLICTKPHLTTFRPAVKQGPSSEEVTTNLRGYLLPADGKF